MQSDFLHGLLNGSFKTVNTFAQMLPVAPLPEKLREVVVHAHDAVVRAAGPAGELGPPHDDMAPAERAEHERNGAFFARPKVGEQAASFLELVPVLSVVSGQRQANPRPFGVPRSQADLFARFLRPQAYLSPEPPSDPEAPQLMRSGTVRTRRMRRNCDCVRRCRTLRALRYSGARSDKAAVAGGNAFDIRVESLPLRDFTSEEI